MAAHSRSGFDTPVSIKAAVVREPNGPFVIEDARIVAIRPDEVLVRIHASGLCHTDILVRSGMRTPLPAVFGHEGAGIVEAVGSDVNYVVPGDHVVMSYIYCGECSQCQAGNHASCEKLMGMCFSGSRPDGSHAIEACQGEAVNDRFFAQSSFATMAVAHERNLVKVDHDLPLELLAPLGCGLVTGAGAVWNELGTAPGTSLAVFGVGAVGLSAVMAAKVAGATMIVAIDRVPSRLELARELGATHTLLAGEGDAIAQLQDISGGGVDAAFDTTGNPEIIRFALASIRQKGTVGIVAPNPAQEIPININAMIAECKTFKGIVEGGGSARKLIPMIIDLYRQGAFPFDRLIRQYSFVDINQAVLDSCDGTAIKPVLLMSATLSEATIAE